jgi:hypothetical protein
VVPARDLERQLSVIGSTLASLENELKEQGGPTTRNDAIAVARIWLQAIDALNLASQE